MSFEEALSRLDEIIKLLSDENTTLDSSLALYTEGVGLIDMCDSKLKDAKLKIETLGKIGDVK